MARPQNYRGFSSVRARGAQSIARSGIDLIKRDLLNHFYTYPGENRMRPTFGCRLRLMLMEQFGSADREAVIDEVKKVIAFDPRVSYISTTITDFPYGIVITVDLIEVKTTTPFTLKATFNLQSDSLYGLSGS